MNPEKRSFSFTIENTWTDNLSVIEAAERQKKEDTLQRHQEDVNVLSGAEWERIAMEGTRDNGRNIVVTASYSAAHLPAPVGGAQEVTEHWNAFSR